VIPEIKTVLLSTAYLAPVEYYLQMNTHSQVIIEQHCNYVKQTYRNRCVIASANGLQTLSIPIVKPDSPKCLTKDIRIAEHGNWRHLHWNAIVSAYSSTPFFEYYADDFRPFYEKPQRFLFDFNEALRELVCSLLDISPNVSYSNQYITGETLLNSARHCEGEARSNLPPLTPPKGENCSTPFWGEVGGEVLDLREAIHPKKGNNNFNLKPYYQVFENKYGFQGNLSIIDLLFNMGNEAILLIGSDCIQAERRSWIASSQAARNDGMISRQPGY